jgi:two-component system sensor histidine kinase DesK
MSAPADILEARPKNERLRYLWLVYLLMFPLPWFVQRPDTWQVMAALAGIAMFLPIYFHGYTAGGWRSLRMAALILLLGFALRSTGGLWGVFVLYAAAMAAGVQPRQLGARAAIVVGAAFLAFVAWHQMGPWEWAPTLFFGVIVALNVMHLVTVEVKNQQLAESREDARRLAVTAERERISRDVHDLLGHTLTLVAVKADLAGKLVERDPVAARAEIEEIRLAARKALADVRAAVTAMRATTLSAEVASARHALATADVTLDAQVPLEELPPAVETALAFVLREATTNIVRHAQASRCQLRFQREPAEVVMEIRDDGRGVSGPEGNGVRGMRERVAMLGGTLQLAGSEGAVITARVPLGPSTPVLGAAS